MSDATNPNKLTEAMLQAFDKHSLENMLKTRLDKKVLDFVPDADLVNYVVNAATSQGWSEDLIAAALLEQPDNQAIKRVAIGDPLASLINDVGAKSIGTAGEVSRVISGLLKVLNQTPPQNIRPEIFTELNNNLKDLYVEYARLSGGVTAS
jgi:hypothetical protein